MDTPNNDNGSFYVEKIKNVVNNLVEPNVPVAIAALRDKLQDVKEADSEKAPKAEQTFTIKVTLSTQDGFVIAAKAKLAGKREIKFEDETDPIVLDPDQPDFFEGEED